MLFVAFVGAWRDEGLAAAVGYVAMTWFAIFFMFVVRAVWEVERGQS